MSGCFEKKIMTKKQKVKYVYVIERSRKPSKPKVKQDINPKYFKEYQHKSVSQMMDPNFREKQFKRET